jgi:DivIVA domain-containing protein
MPLTPAEVHNVAFKKPPIGKRGYDEEEVDAFLDIVEVELSRLIEENNDLRARVNAGGAFADQDGGNAEAAAELAGVREENQRLQAQVRELERTMSQGKDGAQQQVVQLQQQLAQTEQQLAENRRALEQAQQAAAEAQQAAARAKEAGGQAPAAEQHAQAVQVLALAQQTADQHLAQAKAEAERLLTEAQQGSQQQLNETQARTRQLEADSSNRAQQMIREAEQRAATITAQFEQRKAALERRVEELRVYEREYRTRLRSYLESQLRDLDASGNAEAGVGESEHAEAQQG